MQVASLLFAITVATANITTFPLPTPNANPLGITAGPDGDVWFTEIHGLGRITPTGAITEFALSTFLARLTSGPDGNIWCNCGNAFAQITPAGVMTTFQPPGPFQSVADLTSGPDANIWATVNDMNTGVNAGGLFNTPLIERVTPSATVTSFDLHHPNEQLFAITRGVDGDLWYTYEFNDRIGRITTAGVATEFDTSSIAPSGLFNPWIAVGLDGNVWFTNSGALVRMTPTGSFTEARPQSTGVSYLIRGPRDKVWYSIFSPPDRSSVVGFVDGDTMTDIVLPRSVNVNEIAAGPDGNLWFTDAAHNSVDRLDVASIAPIQNVPALSRTALLLLIAALAIVGILALR